MSRLLALLLLLSLTHPAHAGQAPGIFRDGFDEPRIVPLFPRVGGRFQLPPSPTATQLEWFLGKLAAGAVTTTAEVNAHFTPQWLSGIDAASTVTFMHSLRDTYPDAYLADLIVVTPTRVVATLRSPASANIAYFQFGARYADTQRINYVSSSPFNHNSVQFVTDQSLTLAQAADRFSTLSSDNGLLIARIGADDRCEAIEARNPDTLRATASIFKAWVVGGAATAVRDGVLTGSDPIALTPVDRAPPANEGIALEAVGTPVSVADMARFMIGLSDNTATDHLHERLGRMRLDDWVSASGVADPDVLRPLLKINEQFHVFRTLTRAEADAYVTSDEAYQYGVIPQLEGFGTTFGGFFHSDLLVTGTWRASPRDVCRNFAKLRHFRGAALQFVDDALGSAAGQPNVRDRWDRVWYKGGSLAQTANQYMVFTHAWLLERNGQRPLVLIALSNSPGGGIGGINNPSGNDIFDIQSVTGRMLQLMAEL